MALQNINPTSTNAWQKLKAHFEEISSLHMLDWFDKNPNRAKDFTIKWEDFYVDFSKNRINAETFELLMELAGEVKLGDAIEKYFSGDSINQTEGRAVLHTALRARPDYDIQLDGNPVMPEVIEVREKIKSFSEAINKGSLKGSSGKTFTDVVNIGIGGSDLGPAMVVDSLKYYQNNLKPHFVSNVDGDQVAELLKDLDPETTLFIIVSKTFTTQETLTNANTIRSWFADKLGDHAVAKHFVAVSTNLEKVRAFGIEEENIFPMWNWVGGRFSLWSAVGLSIAVSLGYDHFEGLLKGAQSMDDHFRTTPFHSNIPVVAALISVWYNNFFEAESEAIIPYTHYLNQFATYLQQAVMESNGKGVDRDGKSIDYQTGNIIWGEPGTNSQHAFFQLIHQGTKLIPVDFIGFVNPLHDNWDHHDKLISNFLAQTEALLTGKTDKEVLEEFKGQKADDITIGRTLPFKVFRGNRPTTTILIDSLSPESLGSLIAMYEHKIFVQGIIWNIYSYDQFGVELGKQLAGKILKEIENPEFEIHDSSTKNLIDYYKKHKKG
ncbi:MAG: glucose-6-phosphate isomerase [Flavobacteriaceae bacterium]|nr:glucose-6-phosphate isomerase [Flavobacteriaceae bacterium]